MKTTKHWGSKLALFMVLIMTIFFASCGENDTPEVSSASVKLNVKMGKTFENAKNKKVLITLTNTSTGKKTTYETSFNTDIELSNLPVDMYDIVATYTLSAEEYAEISGTNETEDLVFSAAATGIQLQPNKEQEINLELTTSTTNDFVIKTIYYAGSDYYKAAGENDCFVEIYNNSANTLYADGLCFALTTMNRYGYMADGTWHKLAAYKKFYFTSKGTYDWSKSEGMADPAGANDKYVYGNIVVMVPGSGKDYPIKPGESFIIAPFAQNYKQAFKTQRGTEVTPEWPDSTVDLSHAEFDVVYPGYEELDNKNAANMVLIQKGNNRYMRFSRNGKEGYVIFRHPSPASLPAYQLPYRDLRYSNKTLYTQIPIASIIDAVEVINPNADGYVSPKAFPKTLDASYTYSKPDNSFRCVSRKISRKDKERIILQDLNNSAIDFVEMIPNPKAFAPSK